MMKRLPLILFVVWQQLACSGGAAQRSPREFRVWATSCAHVPADIRRGRESLGEAIRQSEGLVEGVAGFDWDIMIDAGDLSANQTPSGDADGEELIRQYRALTKHRSVSTRRPTRP